MSDAGLIRTQVAMGTLVTIHVVRPGAESAMERAFGWFHEIEACCSRFLEDSELRQLTARVGEPVEASPMLYEAVRFALLVAEESGGAFDPTVGYRMEGRGFDREHRTGAISRSPSGADADVTWRDVELDPGRHTILLRRRLTLDLGAVVKGLAIDTAARELAAFEDFAIDAGGDLYFGGANPHGEAWSVGIRHPRRDGELIDHLTVRNQAVCTSGDYERPAPDGDGHHILDPRTGDSSTVAASATVVADGAMLADALATAAFVLGPHEGIAFLDRMGVDGLIVTPDLQRYETQDSAMLRSGARFFRTPKGLLILILAMFTAIAAPGQGLRAVMSGMLSAATVAGLVDMLILRTRKGVWEFPSGAVLTAMIVAMVLRAQEPWWVVAITSTGAVLSKYLIRSRAANVFNPAALAIVASFFVFHTGQSWWGALTEMPLLTQIVLLAAGLFITDRVNKMPLVLAFLGAYFMLFTVTAYVSNPQWVAEIYRSPDIEAAIFFAFIILTDPPTSPAKYPDQILCGVLVAVVSFAFFEWAGVVYYLLAGVLVGNVWEAWRRVNRRSGRRFPAGMGNFLREVSPWRDRVFER